MRVILSLFLIIFSMAAVRSHGQQEYPGMPGCLHPSPIKLADFAYTTEGNLRARLADLRNEIAKHPDGAQAFVQVYGGRTSRSNELEVEVERVRRLSHLSGNSIFVREMGFRTEKSFEFFIRPLPCTDYPIGISDLRVDEVEFSDHPARRLESSDLTSRITFRPEAKCAPAARAVRACQEGVEVEVFVVIDGKGRVVFSRSVNGHPLNRANAANSVKEMRFTPYVDGGNATSVSGTIRVVYSNPEEIVTN